MIYRIIDKGDGDNITIIVNKFIGAVVIIAIIIILTVVEMLITTILVTIATKPSAVKLMIAAGKPITMIKL